MTTLMLILFIIAVVFFSTALGRELRRKALSKGVEPNPMIRMKHDKIQSDPCIPTIVQFVRAARGIPEHVRSSGCHIDLYGLDKEIWCRYNSFSSGEAKATHLATLARMARKDGREINPEVIADLRRELNIGQFPEGTQVTFKWESEAPGGIGPSDIDGAESYLIDLCLKPAYPNFLNEYSEVIADICRREGLPVASVGSSRVEFFHGNPR